MHMGVDAKRAAIAVELGAARLHTHKARPPNQRAVAKNPKIAHIAKPGEIRAGMLRRLRVSEIDWMTSSNRNPNRGGRGLLWLIGLLLLAFALYSASWFWAAARVRSETSEAIAALEARGISAEC